jgi:hypothetical protein
MFNGQKISPMLPYLSPTSAEEKENFNENQTIFQFQDFSKNILQLLM